MSNLQTLLGNRLLADEPLAKYTAARLGGPAEWLYVAKDSIDEFAEVLSTAWAEGFEVRILGGGANVLHAFERRDGTFSRTGPAEPDHTKLTREERAKLNGFKSGVCLDPAGETLYSLNIDDGTITVQTIAKEVDGAPEPTAEPVTMKRIAETESPAAPVDAAPAAAPAAAGALPGAGQ